jgi:N-acetylneuraminate synthase
MNKTIMKEITINDKKVGKDNPIFLIGEIGVNHNGNLSLAKQLIDKAVEAKIDAVKFQTFITDDVLVKSTPKAEYAKKDNYDDETFDEMVRKLELSREDFDELNQYCEKKGIIFLSTPYDEKSVELLNELNVPAYKISSGDLNNFPLIELICKKKKPILLSTGMAYLYEIKESVEFIKKNGISEIVLYQCTTNYPSSFDEINLNIIETFQKEFPDCLIGFSDHSLGIEASIGAAAKGVNSIEKHFTLDKCMEGPDHKASLNPEELTNWAKNIRNIEIALGSFTKEPSKSELEIAKVVRRSIVSRREIKIGEIIKKEDLIMKRPGSGIPPNKIEEVIGNAVSRTIPKDKIIEWDDIIKDEY